MVDLEMVDLEMVEFEIVHLRSARMFLVSMFVRRIKSLGVLVSVAIFGAVLFLQFSRP